MKQLIPTIMVLLAACASASAHAACRVTQVTVPGISVTYDPFDDSFTPSPVTFAVQTEGDCSGARLELALGSTTVSPQTGTMARLKNGSDALDATVLIAGQARPIVSRGAGMSTNPLSLPIGATGQVLGDATVALALENGQVAGPGVYAATLDVLVRLSGSGNREPLLTSPLNLTVTVAPSVRLAVGGGDLTIDLGELKSNAVGGPVSFDAYANVDYSLMLRSENGFTLRRSDAKAAPGVPYTPVISNGTISAASGPDAAGARQALFTAPRDGMRRHGLRVKVDLVPYLPAGHYSDVLTLEIRASV